MIRIEIDYIKIGKNQLDVVYIKNSKNAEEFTHIV